MRLDTYESAIVSGKFITAPSGTDMSLLSLPAGRVYLHLNLVRRGGTFRENAFDRHQFAQGVMAQIAASGFALHGLDLALFGPATTIPPPATRRSLSMNAIEKVKLDLFHYFEARGVIPGHVISIRDFASQMMPGCTREERAALDLAFLELVAAGVLRQQSSTEYALTANGLASARTDRAHHP